MSVPFYFRKAIRYTLKESRSDKDMVVRVIVVFLSRNAMVSCDRRLFSFGILLLIGLYVATRTDYLRFHLINFRGDVNRKPAVNKTDWKPPCSFAAFRRYLRETRSSYLPGGGLWKRRRGRLQRFDPDLCSLAFGSRVPRDRMAGCLARLNVSYVVILGDSNALRLYKEVRRTLSAVGTVRVLDCHGGRRDDVIRPALPARRCSADYLPLRRYLPPNYFRCKTRGSDSPLLVQYLPVTGDMVPLHVILNSSATGCVENYTKKFIKTEATTIQASYSP